MTTDANDNQVRAKKPTKFLTNSAMIARELARRCSGEHVHGQLLSGRAGPAAKYTPDMCKAIVRGIIAQKELDRRGMAQVDGADSIKALTKKQEDEIHGQAAISHEE